MNSNPQLVSHNSNSEGGYPGDQYGGNMHTSEQQHWSINSENMMWEPDVRRNIDDTKQHVAESQAQSNSAHVQDEYVQNRINVNSKIKNMILSKQQMGEQKQEGAQVEDENKTGHFLWYSHHRRQIEIIDDGGGVPKTYTQGDNIRRDLGHPPHRSEHFLPHAKYRHDGTVTQKEKLSTGDESSPLRVTSNDQLNRRNISAYQNQSNTSTSAVEDGVHQKTHTQPGEYKAKSTNLIRSIQFGSKQQVVSPSPGSHATTVRPSQFRTDLKDQSNHVGFNYYQNLTSGDHENDFKSLRGASNAMSSNIVGFRGIVEEKSRIQNQDAFSTAKLPPDNIHRNIQPENFIGADNAKGKKKISSSLPSDERNSISHPIHAGFSKLDSSNPGQNPKKRFYPDQLIQNVIQFRAEKCASNGNEHRALNGSEVEVCRPVLSSSVQEPPERSNEKFQQHATPNGAIMEKSFQEQPSVATPSPRTGQDSGFTTPSPKTSQETNASPTYKFKDKNAVQGSSFNESSITWRNSVKNVLGLGGMYKKSVGKTHDGEERAKISGTDIPRCNCFPSDSFPPEPGSYYTHLGEKTCVFKSYQWKIKLDNFILVVENISKILC